MTKSADKNETQAGGKLRQHIDDPVRLMSLAGTGLVQAATGRALERYVRIAAWAIGAPVSLVSLVDHDRQFFAAAHGLAVPWAQRRETPLSHSFCQHVVNSRQPLIVSDAPADDRVCHCAAIEEMDVVAYAGMPIEDTDGNVLGSFCVIDNAKREWQEKELLMLRELADCVAGEIELCRRARLAEDAEIDLAQINDQIADAHRHAAEQNAAVMHDIRTPLQVLSMSVESLSSHPQVLNSPSLKRAIDMMRRNVSQAKELVQRDKSGDGQSGYVRLDVGKLTQSVCRDLEAGSAIVMETDCAEAFTMANPIMLQRAVQNLVTNAQRFASSRVRVGVTAKRDLLCISVDDDGGGLPRTEDYEHVWDLGRRFHDTRSKTGLGLAVTRQLVVSLGGRVRAMPSVLGGARFELWVPAA